MEKNSLGNVLGIILGVLLLGLCCISSIFVLGLSGFKMTIGSSSVSLNEQLLVETQEIIVREITATPRPQQKTVVVPTPMEGRCTFNYSIMPTGEDEKGNPLANKGIDFKGTIEGPAIVRTGPNTIVVIYPDASWKGEGTLWSYWGNSQCLEAQLPFFPEKNIIRIK